MWDEASELEQELARILRDSMNIDYPPDMPLAPIALSEDETGKRQWRSLWRSRVPKATPHRDPER
jgi:hypothetical protein